MQAWKAHYICFICLVDDKILFWNIISVTQVLDKPVYYVKMVLRIASSEAEKIITSCLERLENALLSLLSFATWL